MGLMLNLQHFRFRVHLAIVYKKHSLLFQVTSTKMATHCRHKGLLELFIEDGYLHPHFLSCCVLHGEGSHFNVVEAL